MHAFDRCPDAPAGNRRAPLPVGKQSGRAPSAESGPHASRAARRGANPRPRE